MGCHIFRISITSSKVSQLFFLQTNDLLYVLRSVFSHFCKVHGSVPKRFRYYFFMLRKKIGVLERNACWISFSVMSISMCLSRFFKTPNPQLLTLSFINHHSIGIWISIEESRRGVSFDKLEKISELILSLFCLFEFSECWGMFIITYIGKNKG